MTTSEKERLVNSIIFAIFDTQLDINLDTILWELPCTLRLRFISF